MNPTALAIAGYNRPAYFRPTIQSILCNPCVAQCDLWCFFDGGAASCQDEYRFILSQELSRTPYHPREVRLEDRRENWGCERNLIDLRRRLFDNEAYERLFVFEDDMIVGPHYLALSLRLLDWAEFHFSDIGAVQAYNFCRMSKEEKMRTLEQVEVGNPHWWGYLMPRRTWEAIRDTMYEYEDRYLSGGDYRLDHGRIRNWAVAKLRLAA